LFITIALIMLKIITLIIGIKMAPYIGTIL
jgi:hypothetical protein